MRDFKENVYELSSKEIITINGGGVLRKYGVAVGEVVGGVLIKIAFALVLRRYV